MLLHKQGDETLSLWMQYERFLWTIYDCIKYLEKQMLNLKNVILTYFIFLLIITKIMLKAITKL